MLQKSLKYCLFGFVIKAAVVSVTVFRVLACDSDVGDGFVRLFDLGVKKRGSWKGGVCVGELLLASP